jgi:hypothetical protein
MDWLGAVDGYLYLVGRIGLEQALCDGCLSGRLPEAVAGVASIEPELIHRAIEEDGGISESYRGAITVAMVRYNFEVQLFADADGSYFVSNVRTFSPVEWSAGMRVA